MLFRSNHRVKKSKTKAIPDYFRHSIEKYHVMITTITTIITVLVKKYLNSAHFTYWSAQGVILCLKSSLVKSGPLTFEVNENFLNRHRNKDVYDIKTCIYFIFTL